MTLGLWDICDVDMKPQRILVSFWRDMRVKTTRETGRKWECLGVLFSPRIAQPDQSSPTTDVYSQTFLCLLLVVKTSQCPSLFRHSEFLACSESERFPDYWPILKYLPCSESAYHLPGRSHAQCWFDLRCIIPVQIPWFHLSRQEGDRLANQLQQILQLSRLFSEAATLFLLFQSYHEFANYLCREVFTDMSVLPLVFPSNISCFSRGSYKVRTTILAKRWVSNSCQLSQEELARKRELPVPPQPRRTGILARSDDNLAGEDTIELMWSHGALCGAEMIAMFSTCYNSIFQQSNTREIYYRNL